MSANNWIIYMALLARKWQRCTMQINNIQSKFFQKKYKLIILSTVWVITACSAKWIEVMCLRTAIDPSNTIETERVSEITQPEAKGCKCRNYPRQQENKVILRRMLDLLCETSEIYCGKPWKVSVQAGQWKEIHTLAHKEDPMILCPEPDFVGLYHTFSHVIFMLNYIIELPSTLNTVYLLVTL